MLRHALIAGLLASAIAAPAAAETIIGSTGTSLYEFQSQNPFNTDLLALSGIGAGETIVGIDYRTSNSTLYALTNLGGFGRIYSVAVDFAADTAVATAIGAPGVITLNGTSFGVDFNPVPDRLRVVSNTGQNLRLNPNDGTVSGTDAALNFNGGPGTPSVVGAAYSPIVVSSVFVNGVPTPANTTTLYVIDSETNRLYTQGSVGFPTPQTVPADPNEVSPNTGRLFNRGPVGNAQSNPGLLTGLDYSFQADALFASYSSFGLDRLFAVSPANGAAQGLGQIGTGFLGISGIAVVPFIVDTPAPAAITLFGLGAALVGFARRRRA